MRARRCELSVPGSNPKMLEKAAVLTVDEVLFDLEDSVTVEAKTEARRNIIEAANKFDWQGKTLAFRINPVSSQWFYRDLIEVVENAGSVFQAVIVPKINCPEEVFTVAALLEAIEAEKNLPHKLAIEAQIETAEGMFNVERIAAAAPGRLEALIFGPGDYTAAMGAPGLTIGGKAQGYPGHVWHYALSRILVAARTYGLDVIDGPYASFKDPSGLVETIEYARILGCDGKWAIHPSQIETIQKAFSPSEAEINQARSLVEAYQAATSGSIGEKRGAALYNNEMIDAANLRMAQRILARAGIKVSK